MSALNEVHAALLRAGYEGPGADALIERVLAERPTEADPLAHARPARVLPSLPTGAEVQLAAYGERIESFGCGDVRAMYRLACTIRDELVKARAEGAEHQERARQFANLLVDVRNAVGGANFKILPETVRALVDEREGSPR